MLRGYVLRSPLFCLALGAISIAVAHAQDTRIVHPFRTRVLHIRFLRAPSARVTRARVWEKTAGVMRDREQPRITIHIIQQ